MNPIELGKFIAKLRNEKNLTQEELAEKLFIDKRKISRWECGTSIPEFDMLIKLSEILDVSLYELSICKRIENESLTRKLINKFKSAKDFNKYQTRKKIKTILFIILFIILIITTSYTIKYNDTVEIYKLISLDEKYSVEGHYVKTKDFNLFYIKQINFTSYDKKSESTNFSNCEYEFYDNDHRLFHILNDSYQKSNSNTELTFYDIPQNINDSISLTVNCLKGHIKNNSYSFNIKLIKKYSNKLF